MLKIAVRPGEVLRGELDERDMSLTELARQLAVPPNRISQLVQGKRRMTADTALRRGHWFGNDPQFWMNPEARFDLVSAEQTIGEQIRSLLTASNQSETTESSKAG